MYGMIHRAIRDMVKTRAGAAAWQDIEAQTAAGPAEMIGVLVYDDAITMKLLSAAAQRLNLSLSDLLEQFGRHWIEYTEQKQFGRILDLAGSDLVAVLQNLDRLHAAVLAAMPNARAPSFTVTQVQENTLILQYRSQRQGLEPLIKGLLLGLLNRFQLYGEVQQIRGENNASDDVVQFRISHRQREFAQ